MRLIEELAAAKAEIEKMNAALAQADIDAKTKETEATAALSEKDEKIAELEARVAELETAKAAADEGAQAAEAKAAEAAAVADAAQADAAEATARAEKAEAVLAAEPGAIAERVGGASPVEGTAGAVSFSTWAEAVKAVGYARARREHGDLYAKAFPGLSGRKA